MLTTSANNLVEQIHDRMPVILHPDEIDTWLSREITDPAALTSLYQPYPSDLISMFVVSQEVNSARHDSPDLITPLARIN